METAAAFITPLIGYKTAAVSECLMLRLQVALGVKGGDSDGGKIGRALWTAANATSVSDPANHKQIHW